jgi:hypothetical protein
MGLDCSATRAVTLDINYSKVNYVNPESTQTLGATISQACREAGIAFSTARRFTKAVQQVPAGS